VGILEEAAESSDTEPESPGGSGSGDYDGFDGDLSPLAEDEDDDDDDAAAGAGAGGRRGRATAAGTVRAGKTRPRAMSELDEPLTMSSGIGGAKESLLASSASKSRRSRAGSKPRPLASMFWVAPRRRGRRRSSLMDEFQVHSIEDELFAKLRAQLGISAVQFARAFDPGLLLDGRLKAHFSEGASRSFFCKSANEDMIVKTIDEKEVEELAALLPAYVQHLANNPDSLLCRFLALLVVNVRGVGSLYCLVMQNAFPFGNLGSKSFVYDLKGSTVGRKAKDKPGKAATTKSQAKASGLMLAQDFRDMLPRGVPLESEQLVSELTAQVMRDVTLLAAYGLMDYSCLIAITPVPRGSQARVHSPEPARRMVSAPPRRWSTFSAVVSDLPEWHPEGSSDAAAPAGDAGGGGSRPKAHSAKTAAAAAASSTSSSAGGRGETTTVIVQLGIVDLLQSFDLGKQIEHRFKRLMRMGRSANISAVPAEQYAYRFAEFISDVLAGETISLE
jgi:1-phosphatidylinositol-4-phosphate 5-kinase